MLRRVERRTTRADEHRLDRGTRIEQHDATLRRTVPEMRDQPCKLGAAPVLEARDIDRSARSCGERGRHRGRVYVRACELHETVDQDRATRNKRTGHAK